LYVPGRSQRPSNAMYPSDRRAFRTNKSLKGVTERGKRDRFRSQSRKGPAKVRIIQVVSAEHTLDFWKNAFLAAFLFENPAILK